MSLIPAKDYYGKDESITSVCISPPQASPYADMMSADAMAKERQEADSRRTTSSQASEAGSCLP